MTPDAQKEIVNAYVSLRTGDGQPGTQTAYRITVRQLEAIVRLSEALARLHCRAEVHPKHVREARRLLSESIIAVEPRAVQIDADDMELENDTSDPILPEQVLASLRAKREAQEREAQQQVGAGDDGDVPAPSDLEPVRETRKATVSYDRYNQVKQVLLRHMRQRELDSQEDGTEAGMLQKDLISWYIDNVVVPSGVSDPLQLLSEYKEVRNIISHLIKRETTLVVVQEAQVAPMLAEDGAELDPVEVASRERRRAIEERVLAINSNYVFE
jgi:DNA replication licensing factor MCM6